MQGVLAFIIQLSLGLVIFAALGLVADDVTYHNEAVNQVKDWQGIDSSQISSPEAKRLFPLVLATIYFAFGANPILGLTINALLLGLVPSMLALSCRSFGLPGASGASAWIAALAPSFLLWGPWLRRESLSFFLLSVVVVAMGFLFRGRYSIGALFLMVAIVTLFFARRQLVVVAVVGGLAALLISDRRKRSKPAGAGSLMPWLSLVLLFGMAWAIGANQLSYFAGWLSEGMRSVIASNSLPSENLRVEGVSWEYNSSIQGFLHNLVRFAWGPFPWEWKNAAWVIAGLDGILFAGLFLLVGVLFLTDRRYWRQMLVLVLAVTPLLLGSTLLLANYGIAMRVRAHFLPFLIPLVALSLTSRSVPRLFGLLRNLRSTLNESQSQPHDCVVASVHVRPK